MDKSKLVNAARVLALLVTLLSIYIFAPWRYGLYYLSPLPNDLTELAEEVEQSELAGVVFYAQTGSEQAQIVARGWHNRAEQIPAYPEALFKIGSAAKLYVAAAVTKLAAQEQLDLDATLAFYLPELATRIENADTITLRMMVQHRSGIPNFTDQEGFSWLTSELNELELVLDKPADFAPDETRAYSNTNYLLLKQVMTRVLGHSYWHFVQAELLAPLDLQDTFQSVKDVDPNRVMSGYDVAYEYDFKELNQGMVATAADLAKFVKALNTQGLLTAKEQQIYSELYRYGHTGWVLGYYTIARYHRATDTVLVQLINSNGRDTILLSDIIYQRALDIVTEERAN